MKTVVLGFLTLAIWTISATDPSKGKYYILKVNTTFCIDQKKNISCKNVPLKTQIKICRTKRFTVLNTTYVH